MRDIRDFINVKLVEFDVGVFLGELDDLGGDDFAGTTPGGDVLAWVVCKEEGGEKEVAYHVAMQSSTMRVSLVMASSKAALLLWGDMLAFCFEDKTLRMGTEKGRWWRR